ncbi:MAG: hypothetical protein PHD05_01740 [Sphaerochaetaceae bacterium]|nr:hypothetical protein [Sphaerochaetaceae bacterium]
MATSKIVNKNVIILLGVMAAMVGVFFLPISTISKTIIVLIIAVGYLYSRRPYIYFVQGARNLQKNEDKAWRYLKKAIETNIPSDQAVLIGSAFIQQGDVEYGLSVLEKIISENKGKNVANIAGVTASMGYWRQGNIDEAIKILQNIKKNGYEDDNLLINLCTYLLEKGDLNEAKKIINHSEKNTETLTSGMLDNKLWYLLQKEDWEQAREIADELTEERKPKFPEAFVHSAQVYLHFGEFDLASSALETSLTKRYTNTCSVDKKLTENIIKGLEDKKTRNAYAFVINKHVNEIALNKGYTVKKLEEEILKVKDNLKTEDIVPEKSIEEIKEVKEKEVEPEMKDVVEIKEDIGEIEILEDDEKDINTDLTDDDDFSFFLREDEDVVIEEDDEFIEDEFSTDLSEEDEREPNIELDEDDLKD